MDLKELYEKIGQTSLLEDVPKGPTLKELKISEETINTIDSWARNMTTYGILANYIPELKKVDPDLVAIAIGDLHGNQIVVGEGANIKASVQSVIKPFLYLYALNKSVPSEEISDVEATALPFYTDKILQPERNLARAEHPLNNAGAISAAGAIDDFDDFLEFMRKITNNPKLTIMENVFTSEIKTNSNNRAIAYRLLAGGRFKKIEEGEKAIINYTKACSIGLDVKDTLHACIVLAAGGIDVYNKNKRIVNRNYVVRVMNVMNTFGMYEQSGKIALLVAGSRANTCKSGVGGLVININPGIGAFVTYSPLLNTAGNSVYGSYAMIPLNNLLATHGAMRLDIDETMHSIDVYDKDESKQIHEKIIALVEAGEDSIIYRADPKILEKLKLEHAKDLDAIGKLYDNGK